MKVNITLDIEGDKPNYKFGYKLSEVKLENKIWYQISCLFLLDENGIYFDDFKIKKSVMEGDRITYTFKDV